MDVIETAKAPDRNEIVKLRRLVRIMRSNLMNVIRGSRISKKTEAEIMNAWNASDYAFLILHNMGITATEAESLLESEFPGVKDPR